LRSLIFQIPSLLTAALVTKEVINGCKDYPERIYGDWLQNREKLDQKYFERLILL